MRLLVISSYSLINTPHQINLVIKLFVLSVFINQIKPFVAKWQKIITNYYCEIYKFDNLSLLI